MEEDEKSLIIAYFLAVFPPTIFFGLHRHYLGKHGTGILYLLLWFTGIGGLVWFLIDLVNMKKMVKQKNYEIAIYNDNLDNFFEKQKVRSKFGNTSDTKRLTDKEADEDIILKLAKDKNGRLSPTDVALETSLTLEESDALLKKLVETGLVKMKVNDNGVVIYEFIDLV